VVVAWVRDEAEAFPKVAEARLGKAWTALPRG
jgi:hypothetical protein